MLYYPYPPANIDGQFLLLALGTVVAIVILFWPSEPPKPAT